MRVGRLVGRCLSGLVGFRRDFEMDFVVEVLELRRLSCLLLTLFLSRTMDCLLHLIFSC